MTIIDIFKQKALNSPKSIIYPEGNDERVIKAVKYLLENKYLKKAGLVGDYLEIKEISKKLDFNLDNYNIEIINPLSSKYLKEFILTFYEIRKLKGMTIEEATNIVKTNLYFSALAVRFGLFDGFVGGATNTTGDTVKAALFSLGMKENIKTLSSFMIIKVPDCDYGMNGLFLFADCGVIIDPIATKIVDITKNTRDAFVLLFGKEPICALLSYSTKGSAKGSSAIKMIEALKIIHDKYPKILVDGEFQIDAAIVPDVAIRKSPDSQLAGKANVLIFPDLASGNISYKLVQRLAKAEAIGPILQGLNFPANDLSRGCSFEDIVGVSIITILQAQNN